MSDLKICRICLLTEAKLFKFDRFQLLYYYEEVMALKVNISDGLPHYFCYECATMLHKFHKFKEKCYTGQKALRELLWKGPITYESIYKLDRNCLNLQSPLNILKVTVHSMHVRTYSAVDDAEDFIKEEDKIDCDDVSCKSHLSDCDDNHVFDEFDQSDEKPLLLQGDSNADAVNKEPLSPSTMFAGEPFDSDDKPLIVPTESDSEIIDERNNQINGKPSLVNDSNKEIVEQDFEKRPGHTTIVYNSETIESDDKPLLSLDESDTEIVIEKNNQSNDKPLTDKNAQNVKKRLRKRPIRPTTVFVGDNKKIIIMENEPVKKAKSKTVAITRNPKFHFVSEKRINRTLDGNHWKKFNLSEKEAVSNFRAKAEDAKYLAAAFKCTDCFKGFSKEDMLKRHKHLRHNECIGEYECRFCRMRFRWDCQLRKHMRQHFTKYQCLRCDLVCPIENTALLHDDYHNGIVRKCIHCDEEFRHLSTYYTHMRTHRSEHVCALCGASFVSAAGLNQHKVRKHIDSEIESPDDDEEVNTYCEKCDIRFETRKAYNEHLFHSAMHLEGVDYELHESSLPKKILGKKAQKQVTIRLKKTKFEEEKLPPVKSHRKKKKMRRVTKKPMDCHQCGKHFETQAACLKHHQAEHPRTSFFAPNDRHICEICGASLAPGSVAMHQNIHSREKVYPCDVCSRSFHTSVGLKRHMVTHTGEKPFGCSLCDKKFTQSNSMKLHYRTFHLKQPYPKRNRRKKNDEPPMITEDESKTGEESDSAPERDAQMPPQEHNDVHYLTLN